MAFCFKWGLVFTAIFRGKEKNKHSRRSSRCQGHTVVDAIIGGSGYKGTDGISNFCHRMWHSGDKSIVGPEIPMPYSHASFQKK